MISDLHLTGFGRQRVLSGCLLSLAMLVGSGCTSSVALGTRAATVPLESGGGAVLFLSDAAPGAPATARVRANTAGDVVPVDVPDVAGDLKVNDDSPPPENVSGAATVSSKNSSPGHNDSQEFGRIFTRLKAALAEKESRSIAPPPPLPRPKRDRPGGKRHSLFSGSIDPVGGARTRTRSSKGRNPSLFAEPPGELVPARVVAAVVPPVVAEVVPEELTVTDAGSETASVQVSTMGVADGAESPAVRRPAPWWITVVGLVVMGGLIGLSRRFGWTGSPLAE
ncbi:MAG: hypothetical protein CMJ69_08695 [Planctomycetaceae bacterium]|nr:hypothetical protein [Planctomycetaceae bacterium]|tara:strand:- start:1433 stop:2275 length:843 start_codon:yes stop_codon:yes gene_type:complete